MPCMRFNALVDDFEFIDDWEERYKYLIELGKLVPEFHSEDRVAENKVQGCVSQVWLKPRIDDNGESQCILHFTGDSDALIVRGLIYVLIALMSGQPVDKLKKFDAQEQLRRLALAEHLTQQRSNGLASMIARIQQIADSAARC